MSYTPTYKHYFEKEEKELLSDKLISPKLDTGGGQQDIRVSLLADLDDTICISATTNVSFCTETGVKERNQKTFYHWHQN